MLARLLRVQSDLPSAAWDERPHPEFSWVWIKCLDTAHGEGALGLPHTILIYFHFSNAVFTADCLLKFPITEGFVKYLVSL